MSGSLELSAVIVTWNGLRHLPACFDALLPQLPERSEVVLVDNGSTDGAAAWARAAHPSLRCIQLRENLGFAGGVDVGLRAARGELLLLLNDDAFVEPGCLAALRATLEQTGAAAAAGVLTFAHQPERVASAGIRVRRDLLALDLWTGCSIGDLPQEPREIFGVSGGLALVRRGMFEDVGLPEPSFFAYLEDADLAWRARLRGWRSVVAPGARARHVYSATGGQGSAFKQRLLARNRLRTIVRCVPPGILWRTLPVVLAYDLMATGYGVLRRQKAVIGGRLAALRELPALLGQRRAIQARRTAGEAELERWLEPVPVPWTTLREQQRLDALLRQRPATEASVQR